MLPPGTNINSQLRHTRTLWRLQLYRLGDKVYVHTPYNEDFGRRFCALGGDYSHGAWTIHACQEEAVRQLCIELYGDDGRDVEQVTLSIAFIGEDEEHQGPLLFHGRALVVSLGTSEPAGTVACPGISIIKGMVMSDNSTGMYDTRVKGGTEIHVRGFPRAMAEQLEGTQPDLGRSYRIVDDSTHSKYVSESSSG